MHSLLDVKCSSFTITSCGSANDSSSSTLDEERSALQCSELRRACCDVWEAWTTRRACDTSCASHLAVARSWSPLSVRGMLTCHCSVIHLHSFAFRPLRSSAHSVSACSNFNESFELSRVNMRIAILDYPTLQIWLRRHNVYTFNTSVAAIIMQRQCDREEIERSAERGEVRRYRCTQVCDDCDRCAH
jgi:hypothetical protein